MGLNVVCPRCSALMVAPRYDDEPMYCMVCGAQGDMPPTNNAHRGKVRTLHTARYRNRGKHRAKGLQQLTVRYTLAFANRNSPLPALILQCPWCGGVTKSCIWAAPQRESRSSSTERLMYVECPNKHTYSMVCNAIGEYYWR